MVSYHPTEHYQVLVQGNQDGRLYYDSHNILTHEKSGKVSPFRRIVHIDPINTDMDYSS